MTNALPRGAERSLQRIRLAWNFGGGLFVVAAAGLWWMVFALPLVSVKLAAERGRVAAERIAALEPSTRLRHQLAKADVERLERERSIRQERVPDESDETVFLNWVSEFAAKCRLNVTEFRPAGQTPVDAFMATSIRLSAGGSYEAVCRFLDGLRACPRMHRVTSLEVGPADAGREEYGVTLQLMLFSQATPAQSKSI